MFRCPRCGRESTHPIDAQEGYCGSCNDWTVNMSPVVLWIDGTPITEAELDAGVMAAVEQRERERGDR